MATNKFKSKVTNDVIEGATPVEVAPNENEKATKQEKTTKQENSVVFEKADTGKKPPEKNVKIRVKTNHTCSIGGVVYHFEKGKQVTVPENVKKILMESNLLMPI
jgi:hypothetical protein